MATGSGGYYEIHPNEEYGICRNLFDRDEQRTFSPHEYWVPHFPVHHDVLDETHTSIGPSGLPIRWVLARPKLDGLGGLVVPHLYDLYVIHERIGAALAEAGATGYTSKPARSA